MEDKKRLITELEARGLVQTYKEIESIVKAELIEQIEEFKLSPNLIDNPQAKLVSSNPELSKTMIKVCNAYVDALLEQLKHNPSNNIAKKGAK
jgi:hypothetical protein